MSLLGPTLCAPPNANLQLTNRIPTCTSQPTNQLPNRPTNQPTKHLTNQLTNQPTGELREYVESELNVHELELCADPLKYATLRAEPDFQVGISFLAMRIREF